MNKIRFGGRTESREVPPRIWSAFLWYLATEPPNPLVPNQFLQASWDLAREFTAPISPYRHRSHAYTRFVKGGFEFWLRDSGEPSYADFVPGNLPRAERAVPG